MMKSIKGMAYISLLSFSNVVFSENSSENTGYENQILAIEEFETPSATKIIVSFEHANPICAYNPENFQESIDDSVYRAFMPRTSVGQGVVCSADCQDEDAEHSFDCDSSDAGVEFVLYGESIKKYVETDHVVFIVKK